METAIATIAGQKAHLVEVRVLAEDLVQEVVTGWRYSPSRGRNVPKVKEVRIPAGETVYGAPICGTTRTNGTLTWSNNIVLADEVTCEKCAKRVAQ